MSYPRCPLQPMGEPRQDQACLDGAPIARRACEAQVPRDCWRAPPVQSPGRPQGRTLPGRASGEDGGVRPARRGIERWPTVVQAGPQLPPRGHTVALAERPSVAASENQTTTAPAGSPSRPLRRRPWRAPRAREGGSSTDPRNPRGPPSCYVYDVVWFSVPCPCGHNILSI